MDEALRRGVETLGKIRETQTTNEALRLRAQEEAVREGRTLLGAPRAELPPGPAPSTASGPQQPRGGRAASPTNRGPVTPPAPSRTRSSAAVLRAGGVTQRDIDEAVAAAAAEEEEAAAAAAAAAPAVQQPGSPGSFTAASGSAATLDRSLRPTPRSSFTGGTESPSGGAMAGRSSFATAARTVAAATAFKRRGSSISGYEPPAAASLALPGSPSSTVSEGGAAADGGAAAAPRPSTGLFQALLQQRRLAEQGRRASEVGDGEGDGGPEGWRSQSGSSSSLLGAAAGSGSGSVRARRGVRASVSLRALPVTGGGAFGMLNFRDVQGSGRRTSTSGRLLPALEFAAAASDPTAATAPTASSPVSPPPPPPPAAAPVLAPAPPAVAASDAGSPRASLRLGRSHRSIFAAEPGATHGSPTASPQLTRAATSLSLASRLAPAQRASLDTGSPQAAEQASPTPAMGGAGAATMRARLRGLAVPASPDGNGVRRTLGSPSGAPPAGSFSRSLLLPSAAAAAAAAAFGAPSDTAGGSAGGVSPAAAADAAEQAAEDGPDAMPDAAPGPGRRGSFEAAAAPAALSSPTPTPMPPSALPSPPATGRVPSRRILLRMPTGPEAASSSESYDAPGEARAAPPPPPSAPAPGADADPAAAHPPPSPLGLRGRRTTTLGAGGPEIILEEDDPEDEEEPPSPLAPRLHPGPGAGPGAKPFLASPPPAPPRAAHDNPAAAAPAPLLATRGSAGDADGAPPFQRPLTAGRSQRWSVPSVPHSATSEPGGLPSAAGGGSPPHAGVWNAARSGSSSAGGAWASPAASARQLALPPRPPTATGEAGAASAGAARSRRSSSTDGSDAGGGAGVLEPGGSRSGAQAGKDAGVGVTVMGVGLSHRSRHQSPMVRNQLDI